MLAVQPFCSAAERISSRTKSSTGIPEPGAPPAGTNDQNARPRWMWRLRSTFPPVSWCESDPSTRPGRLSSMRSFDTRISVAGCRCRTIANTTSPTAGTPHEWPECRAEGSSVVHVVARARVRGRSLHADLARPAGCTKVNVHVQRVTSVKGAISVRQRDVFLSAILGQKDTRIVARRHGMGVPGRGRAGAQPTDRSNREHHCDRLLRRWANGLRHVATHLL